MTIRILTRLRCITAAVISLAMLSACSTESPQSGCMQLQVQDAWIAEAPPAAEVMAGYIRLTNPANADIRIETATSVSFESIEFHSTRMENGQMKMQRLAALEIPAHGSLQLESGGQHMMLFNPSKRYVDGDSIDIIFGCSGQSTAPVEFRVKRMSADEPSAHPHNHH